MKKHELPDLGFRTDAVSFLSPETFEYHHGKHHKSYVKKLNRLLEGSELAELPLDEIVRRADGELFQNAAQHLNHSFYWRCIDPSGAKEPAPELARAIERSFGSTQKLEEKFIEAAKSIFGSGWCWLVQDKNGDLALRQKDEAGCPLTDGESPLLTCDVWEHAYYIDFRNKRGSYLEQFWAGVNWDFVSRNHAALREGEPLALGV